MPEHPGPSSQAPDPRPGLAVISQELTPYRVHFHRRIVREIPEIKLSTLITWDSRRSPWQGLDDPAIGVVRFGEGQAAARQRGRLATARFEIDEAARIARWLDANNIAAIMSIGYIEWPLLRPHLWARRRRVPVLFWADSNIRGDSVTGFKAAAKHVVLRRLVRWSSVAMPCGRLGREYFLKYGARPDRIILSPYEPDYEQIARITDQEVAQTAARFGLAPDRRRILVCGRLAEVKRPDLAVDAFLAIASLRPDWDLVFAGDGPLRPQVEARIPEALRSRVRFTGFIGEQRTVSMLYRACEVLLHPARFEPWALVINEAVAAGMAVVATDVVGAAAELVEDGVNGRIVPVESLAALSSALLETTDRPTLARMRASSPGVLAGWRRRADPVDGLRKALIAVGVLPRSDP